MNPKEKNNFLKLSKQILPSISLLIFIFVFCEANFSYAQVVIHPRSEWGAKEPNLDRLEAMSQPITDIIIHHSGDTNHYCGDILNIQRYHMNESPWHEQKLGTATVN
jgi:hypothetical protein